MRSKCVNILCLVDKRNFTYENFFSRVKYNVKPKAIHIIPNLLLIQNKPHCFDNCFETFISGARLEFFTLNKLQCQQTTLFLKLE
jgi:hypothetical protein